jgi:hypothetical protein
MATQLYSRISTSLTDMIRSSTANAGAERSSHLGGIGLDVMLTQFAPRDDPHTGLARDADVIRGPAGLDFNAPVWISTLTSPSRAIGGGS